MRERHPQFIVDEKGNRTAVFLSMEEYQQLLDEIEELECIRIYDAAKASSEKAIPLEQAEAEMKRKTRRRR